MRKFQDFLQNLHDIAFAHQCAKASKFRAIFTRNVRKSLHNFSTTFLQKKSTGNPTQKAIFEDRSRAQ